MPKEKYKNPSVTVDMVIFTIKDNTLNVLLIQRKNPPYQNCWAFPGGFVDYEEDIDNAAKRELEEETGIKNVELHQFHSFGTPDRDPRRRVISVAYYALAKYQDLNIKAADDAKDAKLFDLNNLPELAFDHSKVLKCALKAMNISLEHYPTAANLLAKEFSLENLHNIYEILLSKTLNKDQFQLEIPKLKFIEQIASDKYRFNEKISYSSRF